MPQDEAYSLYLRRELELRAPAFEQNRLVSIYLGGGTPSLWDVDQMAGVIDAVRRRFDAREAALEITLEANPRDCVEGKLGSWRAIGINRLSIGVQSLAQEDLVVLGRDHRFGDGREAVERAIAFGGFAISADFILGVPPRRDAPAFLTTTDHLSVYELTIEDRTAFGKRVKAGRFAPLDEDTLTDLYIAAHERLTAEGFEHYEISSYARPGKRAVHNSLYWRGAPFLGLGTGAASLLVHADGSGVRTTNPRRYDDYALAVGNRGARDSITPAERVEITPSDLAVERLWLGMRTSDGVGEADLPVGLVTWLVDEGLATRRAGAVCPTLRGFLMADTIAARIVQAL